MFIVMDLTLYKYANTSVFLNMTHFKIRSPSSGQFSRKIMFEYITCYAYVLM